MTNSEMDVWYIKCRVWQLSKDVHCGAFPTCSWIPSSEMASATALMNSLAPNSNKASFKNHQWLYLSFQDAHHCYQEHTSSIPSTLREFLKRSVKLWTLLKKKKRIECKGNLNLFRDTLLLSGHRSSWSTSKELTIQFKAQQIIKKSVLVLKNTLLSSNKVLKNWYST